MAYRNYMHIYMMCVSNWIRPQAFWWKLIVAEASPG